MGPQPIDPNFKNGLARPVLWTVIIVLSVLQTVQYTNILGA